VRWLRLRLNHFLLGRHCCILDGQVRHTGAVLRHPVYSPHTRGTVEVHALNTPTYLGFNETINRINSNTQHQQVLDYTGKNWQGTTIGQLSLASFQVR